MVSRWCGATAAIVARLRRATEWRCGGRAHCRAIAIVAAHQYLVAYDVLNVSIPVGVLHATRVDVHSPDDHAAIQNDSTNVVLNATRNAQRCRNLTAAQIGEIRPHIAARGLANEVAILCADNHRMVAAGRRVRRVTSPVNGCGIFKNDHQHHHAPLLTASTHDKQAVARRSLLLVAPCTSAPHTDS
jgi:hypothetical protein